jgi:hypothetical protein
MKRLQYINELEGRKDKAEAGVRELRSKVVKAQRQQTGLAQQVEEKKEEVSCYADSSVRSAAWVPAGAFSCRLLRCWIVVRDSYEADRRCARSSKGLRGGHTRTRRGYFAHAQTGAVGVPHKRRYTGSDASQCQPGNRSWRIFLGHNS